MSRVWSSILEKFIIICNHSGCHQLPERSFFIKGKQFPVCARCTGVLLGQFLAILLAIVGIRFNIIVSILLLLIMGMDWFIQYVGLLRSNNIRRVITGFSGGLGLFSLYINIVLVFVLQLISY